MVRPVRVPRDHSGSQTTQLLPDPRPDRDGFNSEFRGPGVSLSTLNGIDPRPAAVHARPPEDQQTGARVYAGNDIDRGRLVRRASAVRGDTSAEAARPTKTPCTTQMQHRRPQNSIKASNSGWVWSPTCRRTRRTTAGDFSSSPAPSSARTIRCTGGWRSHCGSSRSPRSPLSHAGSNRAHRGPDTLASRPAGRATARSLGQFAPLGRSGPFKFRSGASLY